MAQSFPSENAPNEIGAADFNGDGKLDLLVGHWCGDVSMGYFLGNGDGTFQAEVSLALLAGPGQREGAADPHAHPGSAHPRGGRSPGWHAGTRYNFVAWSDSGLASHTITVGSSPATYTATFQTQYQLTISAAPAADGAVTPARGSFYNAGTEVAIAATANAGFQFAAWTGSMASSTSAATSIAMTAPETVVANFAPVTTTSGLAFYPATPCCVADTRNAGGILTAGSTRNFNIAGSACNIPAAAQAYSLNITVGPPGPLGYLTAWPTGQPQPLVSTLNSYNGAIIANAAIVHAGANGSISIFVSDSTHVIADIDGYFAPPGASGALAFCRIADTRTTQSLPGGGTRNFTVPSSGCNIPAAAQAYSLHMTAVPPGPLIYLTAWPTPDSRSR